jgi:hypothetical protein
MTVLGLPPFLFILACGAGGLAVALCVLLDLLPFSIPAAVVVILGLWGVFWKHSRTDHHFDRVLTMAPMFWRGRPRRTLVSGCAHSLVRRIAR